MRARPWFFLVALVMATLFNGCSRDSFHHARQLEAAGKHGPALALYQQALADTSPRNSARRSEILLHMGECLYRMERFPEAFSTFQQSTEADDRNLIAHLRLGEMLLSAGAPDLARNQAMLVLETASSNNEALALLGASWAAADNPALAKEAYERVLASDPKRVNTAVALAEIYNNEDNIEKARQVLRDAAQAQPSSATPLLAMARLEEQEGNSQAAELAYRNAAAAENTPQTNLRLSQFLQRSGRIVEAEQILRRVDAQRNDQPVALGDFQLSSGHPAAALEQYRLVLQTKSTDTHRNASIAARLLEAEIATAYSQQGNERVATLNTVRRQLQDLQNQLDPATLSIVEAELALADDDLTLARYRANDAIEKASASAAAHYVSGLVYAASGDHDAAEKEWQIAVANDSTYNPARLALAELALSRHDFEEADQQARLLVRNDPGNLRGLLVFANALLMQSQPHSAAVIAQRAAALDPTSAEPSIILGELALQNGHIPEALLAFERAVVLDPKSDDAINGLLAVYRKGEVSYAAVQKMEQSGNIPPTSPTLLEIAGRLYAEHGWYKEAIRSFSKAVAIDPNRSTAVRQLVQLQLATGDFSQADPAATRADSSARSLLSAYQAQTSGDWQRAIAEYERSVRAADQSGAAANNLAWLYAEHRLQLDRALQLAQSAVHQVPNDPSVLDTLGFVLIQRREYSSAVKTLETAATLAQLNGHSVDSKTASQIRAHLSEAYLASGETRAAALLSQNRGPFAMK